MSNAIIGLMENLLFLLLSSSNQLHSHIESNFSQAQVDMFELFQMEGNQTEGKIRIVILGLIISFI
jgi:hypothetical protein